MVDNQLQPRFPGFKFSCGTAGSKPNLSSACKKCSFCASFCHPQHYAVVKKLSDLNLGKPSTASPTDVAATCEVRGARRNGPRCHYGMSMWSWRLSSNETGRLRSARLVFVALQNFSAPHPRASDMGRRCGPRSDVAACNLARHWGGITRMLLLGSHPSFSGRAE